MDCFDHQRGRENQCDGVLRCARLLVMMFQLLHCTFLGYSLSFLAQHLEQDTI